MKSIDDMWSHAGPWLHALDINAALPASYALPPTGMNVVARMDAEEMLDSDGVFLQFSISLRLPAYFGWNWPALSECLRDLAWLPADRYVVIIENARHLLSESPEERNTLLRILGRAAESWADPLGKRNGEGIPFNAVFLYQPDELPSALEEVSLFNGRD